MKILHLSDLHIGKILFTPFTDEEKETKELVNDIIRGKSGIDKKKSLILITGDTVNDGEEKEFVKAEKILTKLTDAGFKVMVVPGNHDCGLAGNLADPESYELYKKHLGSFRGNSKNYQFPYIAKFTGVTVIGIDSMQGEMEEDKGLWANGQIGAVQFNRLKNILTEIRDQKGYKHRIVLALHHHPFDLEGCKSIIHLLKDGDVLMDTIRLDRYKVDALLFGHEHDELTANNLYGIPLIHMNDKSTKKKGASWGRTRKHPASVITVEPGKLPTAEPVMWKP
jgi:3',5'-cyclic AMP phosphodiesterase CpdA